VTARAKSVGGKPLDYIEGLKRKARGSATEDYYGSRQLTVECGRVVLGEFIYGDRLTRCLSAWLVD